jgi:hypothetical protein
MFYPVDETMLNNKEYYLKLPKVEKDFFTPREVMMISVNRAQHNMCMNCNICYHIYIITAIVRNINTA